MQALDARPDRFERIGRGQIVVVMGMEIEMDARIALYHLPAELARLGRIQDTQRVGQHDPLDGRVLQGVDEEEHILRRIDHPVGPVLQVDIDLHALGNGEADVPENVVPVFAGRLPELAGHMAEGAFREQVHHLAASLPDPVHREAAVHEAQGFHGVESAAGESPGADLGKSLLLAAGYPRRGHLDPVDLQFLQEQARDGQLLVRVERDAGGLLAVTEGSVEDLDHRCS